MKGEVQILLVSGISARTRVKITISNVDLQRRTSSFECSSQQILPNFNLTFYQNKQETGGRLFVKWTKRLTCESMYEAKIGK